MVTLPWTGIWFQQDVDMSLVTSNATVYNEWDDKAVPDWLHTFGLSA